MVLYYQNYLSNGNYNRYYTFSLYNKVFIMAIDMAIEDAIALTHYYI